VEDFNMDRLIDEKTAGVLKDHFQTELVREVEVKVYTDSQTETAQFAGEVVKELSEIDSKIKSQIFPFKDGKKKGYPTDPYLTIGENLGYQMVFNGTPAGHEVNSLIEGIKVASQGTSGLTGENLKLISLLDKPVNLQVFVTTSCPYCPQSAGLAYRFAAANPKYIRAEVIEAQENQDKSIEYDVTSVPQQMVNDEKTSITVGIQPEKNWVMQILKYGYSGYEKELETIRAAEAKALELPDKPEGLVKLADGNFKNALMKYPKLVVDFWAEWCGPCRMMAPFVEELAGEYKGRVVYAKLNTDESPQISAEYQIDSIPSLLVFENGKLLQKLVGGKPKEKLEEEVNGLLKLIKLV
jgi:thioredoxin 1